MTSRLSALLLVLLFPLACSIALAEPPDDPAKSRTVVFVGDSTVSDYKESDAKRGWGQMIGQHFVQNTKVVNLALAGASTKTFLETPRWKQALQEKADFIFIQFGHNDSHQKGLPESTDADGDYMVNLRRFVKEARDAGATPILVTPMHRRTFDAGGAVTDELLPYAKAMKRVAAENHVELVDLYAASGALFAKLGEAGSMDLTVPNDRTHFTEAGANQMANLVIAEITEMPDPRLHSLLRDADASGGGVR